MMDITTSWRKIGTPDEALAIVRMIPEKPTETLAIH